MAYTISDVTTRASTGSTVWTVTGTAAQAVDVEFMVTYVDGTETGYLIFFINGEYSAQVTYDGGSLGPPSPGYSVTLGSVHATLNGMTLTLVSGTPFQETFGAYGWYTFQVTGEAADGYTIEQLELEVRQRADMVNSEFVSSTEVQEYIEQSLYELYDLLIQKYGSDYYIDSYEFDTDGTTDTFALPADFYKLRGVDLRMGSVTANTNGWVTLKPFNFAERNRYVFPNTQTTFGLTSNLQYHLQGDNIRFTPQPASGQTIRLWYIPRLTDVAASAPSDMMNLGAASVSGKWTWSTPTGTALAPHRVEIYPYLVSGSNTRLRVVVDNGNEVLTSGNFAVAEGTTLDLGTLSATLTGLTIELRTINTTLDTTLDYPVAGWTFNTGDPASVTDPKIKHWMEYVVVDAAIKCLIKEESDPSALMAQKVALVQRLESAAENRDAGSPQIVADSTRSNGGWGWGFNGMGDGGPL